MSRLLVVVLAMVSSVSAWAGEPAKEAIVDWSAWDRILRTHAVDGEVDYDGIARDPGMEETVQAVASAHLAGTGQQERLAFLINAYNVLTVKGILDGRSPRSSFGKLRFFYRDKYMVAGEALSLNALEHDWIRPLGEPRIHFAIVCASASCPSLRSEAYVPARLDEQLDDNARRFINDPSKNRFDLVSGRAELSKIFKWFSEDFGDTPENVQKFVSTFVSDDAVAVALESGALEVKYLDYDWSLNGTLATK